MENITKANYLTQTVLPPIYTQTDTPRFAHLSEAGRGVERCFPPIPTLISAKAFIAGNRTCARATVIWPFLCYNEIQFKIIT